MHYTGAWFKVYKHKKEAKRDNGLTFSIVNPLKKDSLKINLGLVTK